MTGTVYYLSAGHECCRAFGRRRHSRLKRGNAIGNVSRLIGGLNESDYSGVYFQNSTAFLAFGSTSLDANQSYNFDVTDGALSMSLHYDAEAPGAAGHSYTGIPTSGPGNLYNIGGRLPTSRSPYYKNNQEGQSCSWYTGAGILDWYTGLNWSGLDLISNYIYLNNPGIGFRDFDALYDKFTDNPTWPGLFFKDYFCYNPTNDIIGSLLNGHPVAAEFNQQLSNGTTGYHEVFITGMSFFYGGSNTGFYLTYYNSQIRGYESLAMGAFENASEVTGVK